MNNTIKNRSDILFLYEVKYANPNGDPMDMNRPRMDEDSMKCLVTDVRLKRTIRDYLDTSLDENSKKGNEIFIKEVIKEDGFTSSVKDRIKEVAQRANSNNLNAIKEFLLENFIDTRLFGATYPVQLKAEKKKKGKEDSDEFENDDKSKETKDSITLTGPVQFNIGSSLHKVKEVPFSLSPIMASGEKKKTGTLAEGGKKTIKYGLIGFNGIINEKAAEHTKLNENDIKLLLRGIWYGTKELKTTSKNQFPILLIKVDYKPGFYIGDLTSYLELKNNDGIEDEKLESVSDFVLQTEKLNEVLKKYCDKNSDKIISIYTKQDDRMVMSEPIFNSKKFDITDEAK